MNAELYSIIKMASEIAEYFEIKKTEAWDILEELNFEKQELTPQQIMTWKVKVSKHLQNR